MNVDTDNKRKTVYLNKDFCQFREGEYSEKWKRIREEVNTSHKKEYGTPNYNGLICPLCNKDLEVGQIVYMVMNNNKLFPNCVIHKDCMVDGIVNTTRILQYKYDNYRKFLEENKAWV